MILIENARRKQTQRRGGGRKRIDFDKFELADPDDCDFLVQLDQSIDRLAAEKPVVAEVVRLRFFAGMSIEETARDEAVCTNGESTLGFCTRLVASIIELVHRYVTTGWQRCQPVAFKRKT